MRRFLFALVALLSLTLAAAPVKEKKTAAKDKAAKEKALPPVPVTSPPPDKANLLPKQLVRKSKRAKR